MKDYFPSKLAKGDRFCNRVVERKKLKNNIEKGRHTVLCSPRRYGKSSLAYKVTGELKLPFVSIDLFLANDDQAIARRILKGISNGISQILPPSLKMLDSVQKMFQQFKVTIGVKQFSIEAIIDRGDNSSSVDQIFEALKALDVLTKKKNKKLIFFIDEFQDIVNAESARAIQGAIRNVAQETDNIVFLFSGSNRHLLLNLFDDSHLPLYMLCDKMFLNRIASEDYLPYIQKAATARWKKEISESVFYTIMKLTELHPFYVNMLCNQLWESKAVPTVKDVEKVWESCCEHEKRRFVSELSALSTNQQNVIKMLARFPTAAPGGSEFISKLQMAGSSALQSRKVLAEKDMIHTVVKEDITLPNMKKGQVKVLDPLLSFALRKYYN